MFSTRPITSTFHLAEHLESPCARPANSRPLGVETTTAPVSGTVCHQPESTTSPVPGGQIDDQEFKLAPFNLAAKIGGTIWCSHGPRITMGWSARPAGQWQMNFTPCATAARCGPRHHVGRSATCPSCRHIRPVDVGSSSPTDGQLDQRHRRFTRRWSCPRRPLPLPRPPHTSRPAWLRPLRRSCSCMSHQFSCCCC